ncbi:MAG: transposase [Flavobacteriales bacterium]|nr:transposase [Flavobacteriales bacterium]
MFISSITDGFEEIETWRNRPLEEVYVVIYLDAVHYKVRENRKVTKAVYSVYGVRMDGERDVSACSSAMQEHAIGRVLENIRTAG